ncbi:MAG: hypothetical protein L3J65_06205 [Robiginitomaculum sp.]|nr:hypothetical protein [Robiginitomaculum sp.]
MKYIYMGVGAVSKTSALHLINVFEWFIDSYVPRYGLPDDLLFPESEMEFFKAAPPEDENMRAIWIERRFREFKNWFNMEKMPIVFKIEPAELITRRKGRTQQNRLTEIHSARYDEKYYVDDYGLPIFYYNDILAGNPGYINYRIIKKFSDMLHKTEPKPIFVQETPNIDLYIMGGALMGLGHLFCSINRGKKKLFSYESRENKAAFILAMYFSLRGVSRSQAMKSCGHLLSDATKRDLRIAFRQLMFFKKEMQVLHDMLARRGGLPAAKAA